ncbi:GTP-binding protein [Nostoc commune NIES-4072]|uniref:GTP-binding protein n=1 Tax=Nostoc commune NIES-4072 TaxID=2005467 RepID=A0A2R5FJV5_NOSCO|nr:GTPase [Nostoc commune]BBD69957.1 GTP-binding protein [Nostoc commune HK-02]GBG19040.1 GTP-binding protein [Nostoc commune NIES-4072]
MADKNTNYSNEQLRDTFNKQYESFAKDIGQCNILLLGKTGVGKSTLVNAVFGEELAQTGTGKPITQDIEQYRQPGSPITLYDTPGLELTGEVIQRLKDKLARLIDEKRKQPIENHIHVVWFCISERSSRFEDAEEEWIKDIVKLDVPVIIVLTQTYDPKRSKLLDFIKKRDLLVDDDVIPVLAEPVQITDDFTITRHGLEHLVEVTASILPEVARKAFIAEQKVNVNLKISEAEKYLCHMNEEEFGKKVQNEYKSYAQKNGKCNAMVIGLTGAGKSTLINAVFGFEIAKTGTGKPITEKIEEHSHPDSPVTIYDTPGLEVDEEKIKRTKEEVVKLIAEKRKQDAKEHIHFVWYCISDNSKRIQNAEEEWIKDLAKQEVPVIIVLTQTYNPERSELLDFIKNLNLPVDDLIPVLADPFPITNDLKIPAYGLEKLIKVTYSLFPEQAKKARIAAQAAAQEAERTARIAGQAAAQETERTARIAARAAAQEANKKYRIAKEEVRKAWIAEETEVEARTAFISAQKVDVDLKISEAEKYLNLYLAGAALAGSPLSGFVGGLATAGVQTAMVAHLTYICGLKFNNSFLWAIYAACASVSIPTLMLTSIPVIGSFRPRRATLTTYLMGKALLIAYEKYLKAQNDGEEMSESELSKIIIDSYKNLWKVRKKNKD